MNKEDVTQYCFINDEETDQMPLMEIKKQISQLDRMIKKVDYRLKRYTIQMQQLKGLSDNVQQKVDLGLNVFQLARDGNEC
jgi:hypothetical protein